MTRVLIVEDNPGDVDLIKELLFMQASNDFIVDDVGRLSQAFDKLKKNDYDIILLDLNLPDSKSFDGLKILKEQFPEIPVVVITGGGNVSDGLSAVQAGAQDYIQKGFSSGAEIGRIISYSIERKVTEKKNNRF
jgi:DNA-binding response OmpR family regulator